jgi:hypothetical protein
MKRIKSILVCGLVLALTGVTSLVVAAGGEHNTKAIVRSIHGKASYKLAGGDWVALRVNQELAPGTELKTEADSAVYLQVNGYTSTVKLTENTTLTLAKMLEMGSFLSPDTSTDLKLDGGTVLGSVKKISANSDYKITVPNGVAGIRGTDFEVTVTVTAGGGLTITFTSVSGNVFCQVNVPPGTVGQSSQTLTTGQSWTVQGTTAPNGITTLNSPTTLPPAALGIIVLDIEKAEQIVHTAIVTSTPGANGTTTTTTIVPPNTSASQTGGNSSSTTTTAAITGGSDDGDGGSFSLTSSPVSVQ